MNLVLIVQGYIIVTVHFISIANGLQCLECQDVPHPKECRVTTTCSGKSKCYVEQVVTSGGLVLYNTGCAYESRCISKHSFGREMRSKRQETVSKTDIGMCIDCCDGDFCNIEGCGQTATKPPQRPPLCFTCSSQLDPNSCREVTLCDPEHMCALHQSILNSADWKSECMRKPQCSALSQLSLTNSDGPCYTCCQEDFCNNNCNNHESSTTTSLAPALATTQILSSLFTSTENPILTPTKGSTDKTISTLSAVLTSSTLNENMTETTKYTTLSKPVPLSTVTNSVSLQYTTTNVSTTPSVVTATSMTSTYSNITTYIKTSTQPDISPSHATGSSAEPLTSVTLNNTNGTVKGYDLSTSYTSSLGTMTSPFKTSNGMTKAIEIKSSHVSSTMSVQTPVSLTYSVTSSSKTSLFYSSTLTNISASTPKPLTLPTENGTENSTTVTNRLPTVTQTTQVSLGTTIAKQPYTVLPNTENGTANSTTVTDRPSTLKQTTQISIETTTAKPPITNPPKTEKGTENSTTVTNRPPTVTQKTKGSLGTSTAKQPYTILPKNGTANSTAVTNRPPTLKQTSQIPIRTTTAKPPYTIPPKTENGTENSTSVTNRPPTMTQTTQISLETSTAKQQYTILPNTENGAVNSTIVTNIPPTVKQITQVSIGTTTAKQPYTIPPKTETGTVTANSTTVTNRSPTLKQTTKISIQTTTAKPPYTIPPKTVMCAMCSGPDFLCEKLYEIKPCEPPNNYCINKLENHKDGSRKVTRQCGDFQTCYRDWFLGSSDNDKCRNFDENNIVTLEYQCTYCCIHDNCSVPIRPADASLYKDL